MLDIVCLRKPETKPGFGAVNPEAWEGTRPMTRGVYRPFSGREDGHPSLSAIARSIWCSYGLSREGSHFTDRVSVWLLEDGSTLEQTVMWDFFHGWVEDQDGFLRERVAERKREL